PAVGFDRRSILGLLRLKVPIELSPCGVAMHMNGYVARRQLAFREGGAEEVVESFHFLPSMSVTRWVDKGHVRRSPPNLCGETGVGFVQSGCVNADLLADPVLRGFETGRLVTA